MEEKKCILIVEDERAIVEILKFNLKREGYDTLEALDGEAGLELARAEVERFERELPVSEAVDSGAMAGDRREPAYGSQCRCTQDRVTGRNPASGWQP